MMGLSLLLRIALLDSDGATAPSEAQQAQRAYRMVRQAAGEERRARLVRGSTKVAIGGFDVGVGLYTLLALRQAGPTVKRSSIVDLVAGSGLVLDGVLGLARRGPLETLRLDRVYLRLAEPGVGNLEIHAFERRFAALARRGRIERLVAGSLSMAGGVAIGLLGGLLLFQSDIVERPEGETILGGAMIGSSLGFLAVGVQNIAIPSAAERAWKAWRNVHAQGTRASPVQITGLQVTWGGVAVLGRF